MTTAATGTVLHGDALDMLPTLPDNSVDAVVTDPPYGLAALSPKKVADVLGRWAAGDTLYVPETGTGFMAARWDRFVPPPGLWAECLRVLKPGGFATVFAGARTVDLMGISLRMAGFEMHPQIGWVRAGGTPKTPDMGGGRRVQLKPALEPILVVRKPFAGPVAANLEKWGTGTLNMGECVVPFRSEADRDETMKKNRHGDFDTTPGMNKVYGDFTMVASHNYSPGDGRLPSNLILDQEAAEEFDELFPHPLLGGASRFFPIMYAPRAPVSERPIVNDVRHNCVKPLTVMEWLARIACPLGGVILDPFGGSGSTLEAALQVGRSVIVIEREAKFIPLIELRAARAQLDAA